MPDHGNLTDGNQDYLAYCAAVAKGKITVKDGLPISKLKRLQCQHVVNQHAARKKEATTLFSLINGLHAGDITRTQIEHPDLSGAWFSRRSSDAFLGTISADISGGHLVVRDLIHLLRCNDSAELRRVLADTHHPDWFEVSICFVVTYADARSWLSWHGRAIPDWLGGDSVKLETGWAISPDFKSPRRRNQVQILETLIRKSELNPLEIPRDGKAALRNQCLDQHGNTFTKDGFRKCWQEMVNAGLLRVDGHDRYANRGKRAAKPQ